MPEPPTSSTLAELLGSTPSREAADAIRGFDWQRWLTVEAWLGLQEEEAIWIEWGEDLTVASAREGARTIQARNRAGPITLGQAAVRSLIDVAFSRDPKVQTIVWTSAIPGLERNDPFGEPGVEHWRKAARGEVPVDALRSFLTRPKAQSATTVESVSEAGEKLPELLQRIEWVTGEGEIDAIRRRVEVEVERRLTALGIPSPDQLRRPMAATLFDAVAEVGVRRDREQRRLTRLDLNELLRRENIRWLGALAPTIQAALTSVPVATTLLDRLNRLRRAVQFIALEDPTRRPWRDLATELLEGSYQTSPPEHRAEAAAIAAWSLAPDDLDLAHRCLTLARTLPATEALRHAELVVLAQTDPAKALRAVRDEQTPYGRALTFSFASRVVGLARVLDDALPRSATQFAAGGLVAVLGAALGQQRWAEARAFAATVAEDQKSERPYLHVLCAIVALTEVVPPRNLQALLSLAVPIEAAELTSWFDTTSPILSGKLAIASGEIARAREAASEFGLRRQESLLRELELWLNLENQATRSATLARLRSNLVAGTDLSLSIGFAVAYGISIDREAARRQLLDHIELGGCDIDDVRAVLAIFNDPGERLSVLEKHSESLKSSLGVENAAGLLTELLIRAGRLAEARQRLEAPDGGLAGTKNAIRLGALLASVTGQDAVAPLRSLWETSGEVRDLESYCRALGAQQRWSELAPAALELARMTREERHVAWVCDALVREKRYSEIPAIVSEFAGETQTSVEIRAVHSRALFLLGDYVAAKPLIEGVAVARDDPVDDLLLIQFYVESGDWEALHNVIERVWSRRGARDARGLSMAAALAADLGLTGRALELSRAALAKEDADAATYLAGWTVATTLGVEDTLPDAREWFNKAFALSGEDGPMQAVPYEEVVKMLPERRNYTLDVNEKMNQGEAPLFVAAEALNMPMSTLILGSALANQASNDPRKRWTIPTIHAGRPSTPVAANSNVAVDLSTLLSLAAIDVLVPFFSTFDNLTVGHGVLSELFEDRRRLRRHQPSRTHASEEIQRLLATGSLLPLDFSTPSEPALVEDVGVELAGLLQAARERGARLVRPAPVHRPGSLLTDVVDMSRFGDILLHTRQVLEAVRDLGILPHGALAHATAYLQATDAGWQFSQPLADQQPIILEALAVHYLQAAGLLEACTRLGFKVWIDPAALEEARGEVEYQRHATELELRVDQLRRHVRDGIQAGTIRVAPVRDDEPEAIKGATARLSQLTTDAEVMVIDDRGVNRYFNMRRDDGYTAPIATVIDVLTALESEVALSLDEHRALTFQMLRSQFGFVLISAADLLAELAKAQIIGGEVRETWELRAAREYTERLQMLTAVLRPEEAIYLDRIRVMFVQAGKQAWAVAESIDQAAAWSAWLWENTPDPRACASILISPPNPEQLVRVYAAQIAALCMPDLSLPTARIVARREWLEANVLRELAAFAPDVIAIVADIIAQPLQDFIAIPNPGDEDV